MVVADDFPLLDAFWTLLIFFGFVIWVTVLLMVLYDNFHRKDHSGMAKAGWTLFVIFLPVIGVLVYIGTRSHDVATAAQSAQEAPPAATGTPTDT
jgi:Phospholipase_D-nuclease N-terminal